MCKVRNQRTTLYRVQFGEYSFHMQQSAIWEVPLLTEFCKRTFAGAKHAYVTYHRERTKHDKEENNIKNLYSLLRNFSHLGCEGHIYRKSNYSEWRRCRNKFQRCFLPMQLLDTPLTALTKPHPFGYTKSMPKNKTLVVSWLSGWHLYFNHTLDQRVSAETKMLNWTARH